MKSSQLCLLLVFSAVGATCGIALSADKVIYRKASPYAEIVVTEDSNGLRSLRFGDEPNCQSIVKVGDPDHVVFEYVQALPVALTMVKEPKRVLMVGLGGGSFPSLLRKHYPKMKIDIVDIDPDVVTVAKKYFGFQEDDAMHVYVDDGRRFIERCKEPYDIIFLDAYAPDNIPYSLATKEFLEAVRRAVGPKGLVAANVWSQDCNPMHDHMLRTYQEVFDDVYGVEATGSGNEIILALPRKEPIEQDDLVKRVVQLSKDQKFRFDASKYVINGFWHADEKDPAAKVLLDKDAPKEKKSPEKKKVGFFGPRFGATARSAA